MTTGQTMLAVGALALLTTIMLNFYSIFNSQWETVDVAEMGIDATTIATSFMEFAHGLSFDENVPVSDVSELTHPDNLGPDPGPSIDGVDDPEIVEWNQQNGNIHVFNDFDDLNGYKILTDAGQGGVFEVEFEVSYVDPDDVTTKVGYRTFTKRLDVIVRRVSPPPPTSGGVETVSMWTVMGYY